MAMTRVSILSLLFAISTVFFKSAMVIFVPLYLDSLQGRTQQNASGLVQNGSSPWGDVTNVTRDATHVIDFYWSVVLSWCVDTCIYGEWCLGHVIRDHSVFVTGWGRRIFQNCCEKINSPPQTSVKKLVTPLNFM